MLLSSSSILFSVFLLIFGGDGVLAEENELIVTTSLGKLKGSLAKSYYNRPFRSFKGIQYGKAPTGNLRFKPPLPVDPWSGVVDATQEGPPCLQFSDQANNVEGAEDCLFLNVFVPEISDTDRKSLLPVMIFFHGGGFMVGSGSPSFFGPEKLMDHDVILITLNYRLGLLGFLNTEDSVSTGNYGLLDQVLAMKWVKENIKYFGGDPDRVTIFGHSAGGGSVLLHLLSPISKGLFSGAIAQSGAALSPWSPLKNPSKWAKKAAEIVKCDITDTQRMFDCLQKVAATDIVLAGKEIQKYGLMPPIAGPTIESPGGVGFLTENPVILLKERRISSKVPIICGIVPDEGHFFNLALRANFKTYGHQFFDEEFPQILSLIYDDDRDMSRVISEIENIYYRQEKFYSNSEFFNIILGKVLTDLLLTSGITKTLDYISEAGLPTYAYFYTHMGEHSFAKMLGGVSGRYITHGDELYMLFQIPTIESIKNGTKPHMNFRDTKASQTLNSLWVDFAYGNAPKVKDSPEGDFDWLPYDSTNRSYLNIKINPEMENGKLCEKFDFWMDDVEKILQESNLKDEL